MFRITVECTETQEVEYFCFDNLTVSYQTRPAKRTMKVLHLLAEEGFSAGSLDDAEYAAVEYARERELAECGGGVDHDDGDDDGEQQ